MKIAHLSDVQIRTYKRHKEFQDHFQNLYASLKSNNVDAIVMPGDIVHQKSNISPELVDICVDFFKSLSEIAPLYITPGNHDLVLNNLGRLDSLSPIIKALNSPNIRYFKDSGVYPMFNGLAANLVVFSCLDENWPEKAEIPENEISIGLFHGMVQGAVLQNGQLVEDSPYNLKDFLDKVNFLMLGDIHKHQILDMHYRAAYCGSLIQQNYGESLDKGYLLWNIRSKNDYDVDFVKLPNICPFYTVRLAADLSIPDLSELQKNSRIRIFSKPLTVFEKKEIEDKISFLQPVELLFLDENTGEKKEIKIDSIDPADKLEEDHVQEKLLKSFLKSENISESVIQKVIEVGKKYSDAKLDERILRHIQYRFGVLEYSNLFSYGENNRFDFSKYKGILGVFGKNAVGKSSLAVDIPLYVIFNKISKKGVVKNDLLINENHTECFGSLDIVVGQDTYKISRTTSLYSKSGKRDNTPVLQGRTDVDFRVLKNGQDEVELNGEERAVTDENIRAMFGNADDFMATFVSPQWQLLGFIDAGGTERQKMLGRYFDIDIFEKRHKLVKEDLKSLRSQLKLYEGTNFDDLIDTEKKTLELLKEKQTTLEVQEDTLRSTIKELEKKAEHRKPQNVSLKKFNDKSLFSAQANLKFVVSSISGAEKELRSFSEYKCLANENCCMRERQAEVVKTLATLGEDKRKSLEVVQKLEEDKRTVEKENRILIEESEKQSQGFFDAAAAKITEVNTVRQNLIKTTEAVGLSVAQIKSLEGKKGDFEKLKLEYDAYFNFAKAMSKDGISKIIIANNLDLINSEIKKILSKSVNFSVELESEEEGKAIEIYFKHERSKKRRIELCSGMEKTIAALAVRAALVSVTTLPKSNVFVLDEVFSSLDPEYVDAVSNILNYLKQLFDSVIIITHIEAMKDLVDHVVEISRNNDGYSVVSE